MAAREELLPRRCLTSGVGVALSWLALSLVVDSGFVKVDPSRVADDVDVFLSAPSEEVEGVVSTLFPDTR